MNFVPNTEADKKQMLAAIGVQRVEDLIGNLPQSALYRPLPDGILKNGLSEMEAWDALKGLAAKNVTVESRPSFLGAGAYHHFIPSVISPLITRGEFITAYTPYQPEASQGTLQATFEFQTMIAELYGMDVANASLYDGASALAEAVLLALRETGRKKVLISRAVHPEYREVVRTYCKNFQVVEIPFENGQTSVKDVERLCDDDTACVALQSPNFFGVLEEGRAIADMAHFHGALVCVSASPMALGVCAPPGEYGADIATGEGQPLGVALNYGGPYLGLIACKEKYMRKLPGRICGMTKDLEGKRGYVLTLQTREQHIRREKATSNICTNEALMALAATVYLSMAGPDGMREVSELCLQKAHYAAEQIGRLNGFSVFFRAPFFNEFVVKSNMNPLEVQKHLAARGIIGGLPLADHYPELKNCTLYCCTEMNTKAQIDALVEALKGVRHAR